jgi:hypothetical protein
MVPGYVNIAPDFPEALDDFQYLWFESEYTIGATSKWILLGNAVSKIAKNTTADGIFTLMPDGKTVKATLHDETSVEPLTFIVASYDAEGRLIETDTSAASAIVYADGVSLTLRDDAKSIKAFLWDETFVPICAPGAWQLE